MAIIWELTSTAGGELNARLGLYSTVTNRGFTGHEHLDSVGLIHMNGRAYDPELGRFLSVDPFIQFPDNSQSLNPYTYVMNNPLSGTDPTGYMGMFGGGVSFGNPFGGNSSNPYGGIGRPIHPPRGPTQCEIMCVSTKGADGGSAPTNIEEKPKDKTANIENQKDGNSVVTKAASGTAVTVNNTRATVKQGVNQGRPNGGSNKSNSEYLDTTPGTVHDLAESTIAGKKYKITGYFDSAVTNTTSETEGESSSTNGVANVSKVVGGTQLLMSAAQAANVSILRPKGPLPFSPLNNGNVLGVAKKPGQILYPLSQKAGQLSAKLGMLGLGVNAADTATTLMRTSATNSEKGASVATTLTGVVLAGVGTLVSAPVALTIGVGYFAVDYFFDVNSLYKGAIHGLSNAFRREEYEND